MSSRQKLIAGIVALGLILIAVFSHGLYSSSTGEINVKTSTAKETNQSGVKVLSTNPASLDGATVSPTQILEITFNKPLVRDDTRIVIEPKTIYTTDLSADHKTLKIIPHFDLGLSYTLTIKSGYDTDTGEKLDQDLNFHFQTISYNGV